jgi:hypothetical protein
MHGDEKKLPVKVRGKTKKKQCIEKLPMVLVDSPAICTRSRIFKLASPATNTRSKQRLSL